MGENTCCVLCVVRSVQGAGCFVVSDVCATSTPAFHVPHIMSRALWSVPLLSPNSYWSHRGLMQVLL